MKTGIGQSKYRNLTLFHVVWSVPAKVFLTVTFSILYILTDHDLFGSDVVQDCSYTVFAVLFLPKLNTLLSRLRNCHTRFAAFFPLPSCCARGIGWSFRCNEFWDRLGGQAQVVMIGPWYSRQTNHSKRLSTQTIPKILAWKACTHSLLQFLEWGNVLYLCHGERNSDRLQM